MKNIYFIIAFSLIILTPFRSICFQKIKKADTNEVIKLNKLAYDSRLDNSEKTVIVAEKAIQLAKDLDYGNGVAEAYRMKGIGLSYQLKYSEAYTSYLEAARYYESEDNKTGEANVNMNLGNLFREDDYKKALSYYNKVLPFALSSKDSLLIAKVKLNIGTVHLRTEKYTDALSDFTTAQQIFEKLSYKKNIVNIILCTQNIGVVYRKLNQYDKAKVLLLKAIADAKKQNDMKATIASIEIPLTEVSIATNNFDDAERYIKEGLSNAPNAKSTHDFNYLNYQLELKRKRYDKAVVILADLLRTDSTANENFLLQQTEIADKNIQLEQNKLTISEQRNTRSIAIGIGVGAVLLLVVVGLLIINVKRKTETNKQLTELNAEVSRQKENVDRINRHLEEIIDERTKDLQVKNKKLAEHSSYLSHQIRGPIATLKGLMNLEKEGLVDKQECINMMNKCVSEIDDKIIDMSDMLHNPSRTGL